jgi:hypothetical protein
MTKERFAYNRPNRATRYDASSIVSAFIRDPGRHNIVRHASQSTHIDTHTPLAKSALIAAIAHVTLCASMCALHIRNLTPNHRQE